MMRTAGIFRLFTFITLLLSVITLTGCNMIRYAARVLEPPTTRVQVNAEYLGLANKTTAVMVVPNSGTQLNFPEAEIDITKSMTSRLSVHVPGIKLVSPEDIVAYQKQNPHWITLPYSELLKALKVERLVHISLTQYDVHEPGNRHVWRGHITARVSVAELEAANADNFVFSAVIQAVYPQDGAIGLLNSDRETIQLGMLKQFAQSVTSLFYDHEYIRENPL